VRTLIAVFALAAAATCPDLDRRLAKWRPVPMPFHSEGLSARERQLVEKLAAAAAVLDDVYWQQSDPAGYRLLQSLAGDKDPCAQKRRRLLVIHGGRYDLLAGNQAFAGDELFSPGRGFYPQGLTREGIERYVREHPQSRAAIYSPYTVVRRRGSELVGAPYRTEYRTLLERAAKYLRDAAALSDDASFARFLRLRADALLSDDYYESDLAWLDLKNPKFDVIFAPYETYLDDVLGVKTSFGSAVLIRNETESRKLELFEKYIPQLQDALPVAAPYRPSKQGHTSPMEVMDSPFRGGDLRHGYQPVADNLPNDPRIHEKKGSKKIFFKNFGDARVEYVILPIARRLMRPDQAAKVTGQGYLYGTILHEISHELGPAWAQVAGRRAPINEAIGPAYSGLEEAKADVAGMFGLKWLVDRGALPKENLEEYYASYVGGLLRTLRFGAAEAHGQAETVEFNYLGAQGAVVWDRAARRYAVDYARMPGAIASLARELLEIEGTGDRGRAEQWFARYGRMPAEFEQALAATADIPVDIDPVFSLPR
jgi:hypothetical protein